MRKAGTDKIKRPSMPRMAMIHAAQIRFGATVAALLLAGLSGSAFAKELPDDSFASLAPGGAKQAPSRDYGGLPIGSWMFYPSLLTGVVFDDNVFQSPTNRVSATGLRFVPALTVIRDEGIHKLTLYGTADARFYSGVTEGNILTARAGFLHTYEAMRDLVFRFQADYTRQTDPFSGAGNFNNGITVSNPFGTATVATPFPYNQIVGSASVTKMFNEAFVSLRGSFSHIAYDTSNGPTGSTVSVPPDGSIYAVAARAGYWVSPLFYAYVEPMLDWRRYTTIASDSKGYRIVGGLATNRIGLYRGEIFGGYQAEQSDHVMSPTPSTTASGTVLGARLTYEPTRFLTIRTSVDESIGVSQVNDPTAPPGTLTRLVTAMLQADYAMARDWTATGRFGYMNTSYLSGLAASRHDDSWLAAARLTYTIRANLGLSLEYQYVNLDSNVPNVAFQRNVVTLSGTYKY